MMEKKLSEFTARSEAGKEYLIIEYQEQLGISPYGKEILGSTRLVTSDGLPVNVVDPIRYKILKTGEIVYKKLIYGEGNY